VLTSAVLKKCLLNAYRFSIEWHLSARQPTISTSEINQLVISTLKINQLDIITSDINQLVIITSTN